MRISDWSSDVCSSDLTTLADQLVNRRHEALHLFKLLYRVPVRAKTQKPRRPTGPPGHHTQSAMFKLKKPVQGQRLGCSPTTSPRVARSEEHTSELQSLMRISYAVFCLKKKTQYKPTTSTPTHYTTNYLSKISIYKHNLTT